MTKFAYLNIWFVLVCMDKADIAPPKSSQANQTNGDEDAELSHVAQYVRLFSVLKAWIGDRSLEEAVDDREEGEVEGHKEESESDRWDWVEELKYCIVHPPLLIFDYLHLEKVVKCRQQLCHQHKLLVMECIPRLLIVIQVTITQYWLPVMTVIQK